MRTYANGTIAKTGPTPKSKAERQSGLDKKFGKGSFRLLKYTTANEPAKFKHECGRVFTSSTFESVWREQAKCPCKLTKQNSRTLKSYQAEIKAKHGDEFSVVKFNGIANTKNVYRHKTCGKTFIKSFNSFTLSKYCPNCMGENAQEINKIPLKEFEKRLKKKFGKHYTLVGKYEKVSVPVAFEHKCGFKFDKRPDELLRWKNPMCPDCVLGNQTAAFKTVVIDNKEFKVQGYEPAALKMLAKKYGVENVVTGIKNVRRFYYEFEGKQKNYYPDFIIKKKKLAVEVKSVATLGLTNEMYAFFGENVYERNCAKAKAVIKAGYKFQMRLYTRADKRIKLPVNWYEMSKASLAKELNIKV